MAEAGASNSDYMSTGYNSQGDIGLNTEPMSVYYSIDPNHYNELFLPTDQNELYSILNTFVNTGLLGYCKGPNVSENQILPIIEKIRVRRSLQPMRNYGLSIYSLYNLQEYLRIYRTFNCNKGFYNIVGKPNPYPHPYPLIEPHYEHDDLNSIPLPVPYNHTHSNSFRYSNDLNASNNLLNGKINVFFHKSYTHQGRKNNFKQTLKKSIAFHNSPDNIYFTTTEIIECCKTAFGDDVKVNIINNSCRVLGDIIDPAEYNDIIQNNKRPVNFLPPDFDIKQFEKLEMIDSNLFVEEEAYKNQLKELFNIDGVSATGIDLEKKNYEKQVIDPITASCLSLNTQFNDDGIRKNDNTINILIGAHGAINLNHPLDADTIKRTTFISDTAPFDLSFFGSIHGLRNIQLMEELSSLGIIENITNPIHASKQHALLNALNNIYNSNNDTKYNHRIIKPLFNSHFTPTPRTAHETTERQRITPISHIIILPGKNRNCNQGIIEEKNRELHKYMRESIEHFLERYYHSPDKYLKIHQYSNSFNFHVLTQLLNSRSRVSDSYWNISQQYDVSPIDKSFYLSILSLEIGAILSFFHPERTSTMYNSSVWIQLGEGMINLIKEKKDDTALYTHNINTALSTKNWKFFMNNFKLVEPLQVRYNYNINDVVVRYNADMTTSTWKSYNNDCENVSQSMLDTYILHISSKLHNFPVMNNSLLWNNRDITRDINQYFMLKNFLKEKFKNDYDRRFKAPLMLKYHKIAKNTLNPLYELSIPRKQGIKNNYNHFITYGRLEGGGNINIYSHIRHPITKKLYKTTGQIGRSIIKTYMNKLSKK